MKRPCVFLDRDGVINVSPPKGKYVLRWEEFQFIHTITDWIRLVNALGYLVIVVTNQRCVAKGLLSVYELEQIHARMVDELASRGARVDGVIFCPHEAGCCECRKPGPGMVLEAQGRWDIDMEQSIVVGDSDSDQLLAEGCGLPFIRVDKGEIQSLTPAVRGTVLPG